MHRLDITGDHCPLTFVKTKLELERLAAGERLEVLLREGEPLENVPRSVIAHGYRIVSVFDEGYGIFRLIIEK